MLWLAGTVGASAQGPAGLPLTFEFESADFVLGDSIRPPRDDADWHRVRLPDDWYASRPGMSGVGWYRMTFELPPGRHGSYAIYLPRKTERRIVLLLNGARVGGAFIQGDTPVLNWDAPQRFAVPPALLRPGTNVLHVMVDASANLRQGLPRVTVGPAAIVLPIFLRRQVLQVDSRWTFGGAALLAGAMALALWIRGRGDRVMFWFSVTALAWALMSVPWFGPEFGEWEFAGDLFSFPLHFAYAAPLLLLCLRVAGRRSPGIEAAIWLFTLAGVILAPLADEAMRAAIVTIWSVTYLVALMVLLAFLVYTRAKAHDASFWILVAGITLVVVLNLCDLARWMGLVDYDTMTLSNFHVPLVLLAIGATIVDRHVKAVAAVARANAELEQRVAEKSREIEASYVRLREIERERDLARERRRIMADMHDGVGASLLGLLGMIHSGKAERPAVEQRVHEALLELRLAVDSLEPVDGDLGAVLGNVRYRLREPIEDSGVRFCWQVGELPPVEGLTPKAILEIQRIVLEAIANALRHARAATITVQTQVDVRAGCLIVQVMDDGTGFEPATVPRGRGLNNLNTRARSVGGSVEIHSSPRMGTRVSLSLPLVHAG